MSGLDPTLTAAGRYNRCLLVVAMAIGLAVSGGAIANYALGVVLKDIVRDFHWTRGGASGAVSLYMIGLGAGVPISGVAIDRFGARRPAVVAILVFAALLAAVSLAGNTISLMIGLCLAGLVAGGTTAIPYVVSIASRFDDRRGLALGLGTAGLGLGGLVLPGIATHLSAIGGWRLALRGLAVLVPLIALPGAWLTLNRQPIAGKLRSPLFGADAPWRFRPFWIIAGAIALVSIGVGGGTIHAVALLTDRGATATGAARALFGMALAVVAGRIGGGYLMDRFHAPTVAAGFFLLAPVAFLLLLQGSVAATAAGLIFLGLTAGSEADAISYLSARYLKLSTLGTATGLLQFVFSLANAAGIAALGRVFDSTGSYSTGFIAAALLGTLAAMLITRLGHYPDRHGSAPREERV